MKSNQLQNDSVLYFNGLNGIRTIASLAVVISHTLLAFDSFSVNFDFLGRKIIEKSEGLLLAGFGVSMFFTLSGFLITYLLLKEKDKTNTISIKKFYVRRILRIWPLYYLYLIVSVIFIIMNQYELSISTLLLYVFYAPNVPFILGSTLPFLGHYWSLGVEEQFYLFLPWIVKKIKKIKIWIISLIILLIGMKLVFHFVLKNELLYMIIHVTRFHCMLIGSIGAIYFIEKNKLAFLLNTKLVQVICWICILLIVLNKFHFASVIDNEIVSLITLGIIIGQISVHNRIVNLENKFFNFFGIISYGMYVIHPIIIFLLAKLDFWNTMEIWYKGYVVTLAVILVTTVVAYLSYYYFELYFLKLKHKFTIIKSTNKKM